MLSSLLIYAFKWIMWTGETWLFWRLASSTARFHGLPGIGTNKAMASDF